MRKLTQLVAVATCIAALLLAAPEPVFAEGGCVGLDAGCDYVCFEVCVNGQCITQFVEILGKMTDE